MAGHGLLFNVNFCALTSNRAVLSGDCSIFHRRPLSTVSSHHRPFSLSHNLNPASPCSASFPDTPSNSVRRKSQQQSVNTNKPSKVRRQSKPLSVSSIHLRSYSPVSPESHFLGRRGVRCLDSSFGATIFIPGRFGRDKYLRSVHVSVEVDVDQARRELVHVRVIVTVLASAAATVDCFRMSQSRCPGLEELVAPGTGDFLVSMARATEMSDECLASAGALEYFSERNSQRGCRRVWLVVAYMQKGMGQL